MLIEGLAKLVTDHYQNQNIAHEQTHNEKEGENTLKLLLDEVKSLKSEVEKLQGMREEWEKMGEGEKGDKDGNAIWIEKVRELQDVVDRAREAGGLREVLWPQGDIEPVTARPEVVGEGEGEKEKGEKGGSRELFVKISNQAGRGQGGGGFCGVM